MKQLIWNTHKNFQSFWGKYHYNASRAWIFYLLKKVKYEKTIRGYRIRSYRPKFSSAKNLTFSGQKKLANIREKIAKMLAKTLKKIMPLKY